MKKVFVIHGWEGNPSNAWFPWLRKELEKINFETIIPDMPDTDEPEINSWVNKIKDVVGVPNKDTYFVGHSIGCQAVMRYLESLPEDTKIGGCVFVAGFFSLNHLETEEEKEIAKPWLEIPINLEKIKSVINKSVAIFSDNDPDVDLSEKDIFESKLGSKIIIEHNKGHFSDDANVFELCSVLDSLIKISE
jgi:hypothetical protein